MAKKNVKRTSVTKKKGTTVKKLSRSSSLLWPNLRALATIFAMLIGLVVLLLAVSRNTEVRQKAAKCDLASCNQCLDKSTQKWILLNAYNCPAGDLQACATAGRVGACGGKLYCCPANGAQWTTDMTACANQPYVGSCPNSFTPTSSPTPTTAPTNSPTPSYTPTQTPSQTPTRTPTPTRYISDDDTPTPTSVRITSTATATPTPTVYVLNYCNKSCNNDSECPGGLVCAGGGVLGLGKTCRNSYCKENISCLCNDTPTGGSLAVVPTINELNPVTGTRQIVLTATTVADKNGNATNRPTFSGITEPGAKVTISVFPDGVSGTVTADTTGKWSWRPDKALSAGKKDVVIVAKKDDGQGQVTQSFTVVAGAKVNWFGILLLVMILVAVGFGAYVYYKSL